MPKTTRLLDLLASLPAGDVARTAQALGLTPEFLRKRLEASLDAGAGLLGTATRALKPTETGKLVLEHAGRILTQALDLTRDLEELAGLQAPEVVFGTDAYVAQLPLGATLGHMITANARLRARAVVADFDELTQAVLAGRLEFAIADTTGAERHPSGLVIEPIAEYPLQFYTRIGHPLASGQPVPLEAILVFPLVATRIPQRIAVHLAQAMPGARPDRETGDLSPSIAIDDFSVGRQAVSGGDAIGLAPIPAIDLELRAGKLALVSFHAPWLQLSYGLFHLRKRPLSRAAQLLVTQLKQVDADMQARQRRSRKQGAGQRAAPRTPRGTPRRASTRHRRST
jgi:DNA-binding transcriptional LysR family regulator